MGHLHNGILLSHKKEKILPFATVWVDLENIMLSEISQMTNDRERQMPSFHSYVESSEQTELTREMGTDS